MKEQTLTNASLIIVFSILVVTSGCSLFSRMTGNEVIYAPTEVGTPIGDKVTKDIGPAGGTLSSADGRLMLAVPQNALAETVTFAIQPITNKTVNAIGNAYRLEPDGKTFASPLEISIRYTDQDLDGTIPEALTLAYQDKQGAWHMQRSAKLDQASKTLTVPTKHFTDFAFLARLRLVPPTATVRTGKSINITLLSCTEPTLWNWLMGLSGTCSEAPHATSTTWWVEGEGTISAAPVGQMYNAPAQKPDPNVALLHVKTIFNLWDPNTGETANIQKTFAARITIIDWGYRVSGPGDDGGLPVQAGAYSGVICSLEKPFTLYASANNYNFKFTPSSESNGAWTAETTIGTMRIKGSGTYAIENIDSDKPRIKLTGAVTGTLLIAPYASSTASGTHYFDLTPLDTDECGG